MKNLKIMYNVLIVIVILGIITSLHYLAYLERGKMGILGMTVASILGCFVTYGILIRNNKG